MTQDQYGRGQGPGYVVSGEVVPDEETGETSGDETTPMTRFQKVASALRGDRPAEPAAEQDTTTDPSGTDPSATDPSATDPNGTWSARSGEAATAGGSGTEDTVDDALTVPAGTDQAGAVRSPDAGSRDYWDDEQGRPETAPGGGRIAADPSMTGRSTYATTEPTGPGGIAPEAGYGDPDGTAVGYGSQASTEAGSSSSLGTTPGYGSQAGTTPGYGAEADTATGYATQGGTVTDPQAPTGAGPAATAAGTTDGAPAAGTTNGTTAVGTTAVGTTAADTTAADTTGGSPAGKHAAGAEEAGLRPGEATDRIGDFGDIAFGNLLPEAEQYTARWQQIQFRFVDDPQGSVTEAADVLSQVTAKLEAAIQERQRAIEERKLAIQERASALRGRWGEGSNADTETLRETLRMYRAFMDQLIGSTP
jgi:hypothetical protein